MQEKSRSQLIKVGVFYDGNYFLHVSNYYNYVHNRRNRISISGLHDFIRQYTADKEEEKVSRCQIVDAHYFRGRPNAREASQRGNQLYYDRVFDDILMSEGVVTHYFPLKGSGWKREENVDIWLALEAFELAMYKQFDVVVIIACDGAYVPLVRKLNTLGIRVMVVSWDFEYTNQEGKQVITRTSQDLLKEASYPIRMHEVIDATKMDAELINNLFVVQEQRSEQDYSSNQVDETEVESFRHFNTEEGSDETATPIITPPDVMEPEIETSMVDGEEVHISEVLSLKTGYGFIRYPNNNLFFFHEDVLNVDFNDLGEGDKVSFTVYTNHDGKSLAKNIRRID